MIFLSNSRLYRQLAYKIVPSILKIKDLDKAHGWNSSRMPQVLGWLRTIVRTDPITLVAATERDGNDQNRDKWDRPWLMYVRMIRLSI